MRFYLKFAPGLNPRTEDDDEICFESDSPFDPEHDDFYNILGIAKDADIIPTHYFDGEVLEARPASPSDNVSCEIPFYRHPYDIRDSFFYSRKRGPATGSQCVLLDRLVRYLEMHHNVHIGSMMFLTTEAHTTLIAEIKENP